MDTEKLGGLRVVTIGLFVGVEHDAFLGLRHRGVEAVARLTALENLLGQVFRTDHVVLTEDHRPLDHVAQFADVARPVVGQQVPPRRVRDADGAAELVAVEGREMACQERYVIAPVAQRREGRFGALARAVDGTGGELLLVPDSPRTRTVASERATRAMSSRTRASPQETSEVPWQRRGRGR